MTIAYIEYQTLEEATARDAEFWAAVRGPGWKPGDVTQYVYGRRARTGDPEADAGLPAEGDYFITIAERDDDLDVLIVADVTAPREAGACAPLYSAWAVGVACAVDALVSYADALYRCRQVHTSQSDWTPPAVLALWLVYRPNADQLLEWVGSEPVQVGTQRTYGGAEYVCLQAHVTQADWTPPNVPALWAVVQTEPGAPAWVAGVYAIDVLVTHSGRVWKSLMNANGYEPGVIGTWRDQSNPPLWVAPAGAIGLWQVDDVAEYNAQVWRSTVPNNVYAPGVYGWELV